MKKILTILSIMLCGLALVGCVNNKSDYNKPSNNNTTYWEDGNITYWEDILYEDILYEDIITE